jgi:hypothetical protein
MTGSFCRAAILVTSAFLVPACAQRVTTANTTPLASDQIAELWEVPSATSARDLLHGPGGASMAPAPNAPFVWVSTDSTGYSPGFDVKDADGRSWNVKLGPEAQTEVVASRLLWAIGYHQPPTYYVPSWQLSGGPGGAQPAARFRAEDAAKVIGDWSWSDNAFIGTEPYHGLIAANILLNSWDWKTSNNKIYRDAGGRQRYVVRDLGASLGKTSPSRLLWLIPLRGLGQGTRNDIDGFESQGFIKRADENSVEFHFDTIYGDVVDLVRPSDVRWAMERFNRLTDAQWEDAFRAGNYAPDIRARYIRKLKAKIAEGLAVS